MKEVEKKKLKELKSKSKSLKPILRIGKNGLNESVLKEIKSHLKLRRLIKIKLLRNSLEKSDISEVVATVVEKCDCVLIDKIGLTFSVYK